MEGETLQGFLQKAVELAAATVKYLLGKEMERGIQNINKLVPMEYTNQLLPYFIAAGIMDLTGKDISKNNIQRLFVAANKEPNRIILEGIGLLHYKNHLVYILGIVFLVSLEKEVNMEDLLNVAMALDIDPDIEVAREAVKIYNELAPTVGFKTIPEI